MYKCIENLRILNENCNIRILIFQRLFVTLQAK